MLERLKPALSQLAELWRSLSTPKRLALVFVTSAVLIGVLAISVLGSRERYGVLYTELSSQDAAGIVEKLDALKVPYRLESNGTSIAVPEDRVHALRLELAKSGLPRGGGVGFELFDKTQIGATEFEQRVSLRRALEGELSRSIATIEGVQQARVHLVLPERRLFATQEEQASASVVLKLRNPAGFGKREVAGIVHLVSAAVPSLARERVSVVSTEGLTLHRPVSDASARPLEVADLQAEQARSVGSALELHVKEQLERVVGPGNADVRVAVDLDPTTREKTEEHYDQSKTALRSEHKLEELNGAADPGVAGVPGARTNLPDANPAGNAPAEETLAQGGPGGGAIRRSHTRNWEVDRVTQKTSLPPGDIERLSVAVLLNGRYEERGGGRVYVARSREELAALEEVVKRAVGFDEKRGDSIKLETLEFARLDGDLPAPPPPPAWRKWLPHIAGGLGALLLLAVFVLVRRGRSKPKKGTATLQLREVRASGSAAELDGEPAGALLPPPADLAEIKAQALEAAARDPATTAIVLKKWLSSASAPSPARS